MPVPPIGYGGTEGVVDVLSRGLRQAGVDVRLFSVGSSTSPVPKAWWYEQPVRPMGRTEAEAVQVVAAYAALADVDVIHDHTTLGPLAFGGRGGVPILTTCHGAFTPELRLLYRRIARTVPLVAISQSQRRSAPELPFARVIYHGLDLSGFPVGEGDGGYLAFLGRMGHGKGLHRAIRIARAAGRPLRFAAKMREEAECEYFDRVVAPLLSPDVEYLGEIGPSGRAELLRGAGALLNPISWPEPFGLVMVEALAFGTPVLAFPDGAAPEIVRDGQTGFLRGDEEELARCVARLDEIDRADCRRDVERRFSMERMVRLYLEQYERLLPGRPRGLRPPSPSRGSTGSGDPRPVGAVR
ncbi:glycosyltransferase family 4 protein [Actinotalea sp.]|uniref:glycosyltransferase family 4 protein n=1 Tax=Actinotalea sp. TaxID=1872145 RepID=UPI003567FA4F